MAFSKGAFLKENAKFALGIVTGNNKEYISTEKQSDNELVLKGSDIQRYKVCPSGNYIRFEPESFQQVAPIEIYRAKEKLLYRFISEVPVFTYDNKQTLSLNSCNIVIPEIDGLAIKYVLAILNSSVVAFFISKKFNSVKLLRSHIEQVPIPIVSAEEQDSIIKKVDRMGLHMICSRAMPTALGIQIAEKAGITLVNCLRPDSFKVMTHPERIKF